MSKKKILLGLCALVMLFGVSLGSTKAKAAQKDVSLNLDSYETVNISVGDSGKFTMAPLAATSINYGVYSRTTTFEYSVSYGGTFTVDAQGNYQATALGSGNVTVTGYDAMHEYTFSKSFFIEVVPDMSNVTLSASSVKLYLTGYYYGSTSSREISVNGASTIFSSSDFSYISSNTGMDVSVNLNNNKITIYAYGAGTTDVTVTILGKSFTVHVVAVKVSVSSTSPLLVKGKTVKLRVKGSSEKVTWKSSNTKVATVSSSGKVKTKKVGSAIITARVGDCKVGCVVTVTTSKKKKAIARAMHIAKTSTYSQAKRMQKGFYDCSSLTWRAYSKYGYHLGGSGYAPTAAAQAQYLAGKKKMLKGGFSVKNVSNRKLQAGDLMFETSNAAGRYKGIYHVEMFTGYTFEGFDSNNKAVVGTKWANRGNNYYFPGYGLIGRP